MAVGWSGSSTRAWRVCSSRAARFAIHTRVGVASTTQATRSSSTRPVRTHAGACDGQRFSKNELPSTPFGNRTIVTARPARWGSTTRDPRGQ